MKLPHTVLVFAILLCLPFATTQTIASEHADSKPNIVVIMADDMGFGDVQHLNAKSKIPTPNLNRLAKQGVTFTDAHSPSGVCTPTRYGLVCGRYSWRTHMKSGVLGGYSKPLIASDQQTIAKVLKSAGYQTACIGKWHLGLGWQWREEAPDNINYFGIAGRAGSVDYEKTVTDGPMQHGFDFSYIIPASLDMSPYVYLKNNKVTQPPTRVVDGNPFPAFYRKGEIGGDFEIINCLDHLTTQATEYIANASGKENPFFLYLPLPAPHKPVMPTKDFAGKTKLGPYGDFIHQVDASVGKVLQAIDKAGVSDNTLVIYTSDNGSFMHRYQDGKPDHCDKEKHQGFRIENHQSNGIFRGTKADIWEGGHHVPFFVRWPGKTPSGEKCRAAITHTDILATVAEAAGAKFDKKASPDSYSFLKFAKTPATKSERPALIHHSGSGMFAIRDGKWKLVLGNGSGGREKPKGRKFEKPYQLFDLALDIEESKNVIGDFPEIAATLEKQLAELAKGDQFKKSRK